MRALTIEESFEQFVAQPTQDAWQELRERILVADGYNPYGSAWRRVDALVDAGRFVEASGVARSLESWACLSPRWHYWMGVSALECGDPLAAAEHREWLRICLEALLESGDGGPESPFRVLYPSDAYDILEALGETPAGQQLVEIDGGAKDLLTTESGNEYWFDVACMLARCVPPTRTQAAEQSLDSPAEELPVSSRRSS